MSNKRKHPKVCGRCARISDLDMERKFCPVTAGRIAYNRPADRCPFFSEDEECRYDENPKRRNRDVFD